MTGRFTLEVRTGEYVASQDSRVTLQTSSLGSCVGVALYDQGAGVAGLCHILLDRQSRFGTQGPPGRCADSAIPALVEAMRGAGAVPERLVAFLAGGSNVFPAISRPIYDVGAWNVRAARETLQRLGIPIVQEDVGGHCPRRLSIDVGTGRVAISRPAEVSLPHELAQRTSTGRDC